MKHSHTVMADGRDPDWFDRGDAVVRDAQDRRDLPPVATAIERRLDVTTREWAAITAHRQVRTHEPVRAECPL